MALPDAFYEQVDEMVYRPSVATMSPWDHRLQHGGPPSALAVHVLRQTMPRPELRVAQVLVDFLGAIPRDDMTAAVEVIRPGKRIELARVTLSGGGRAGVSASVWRLAYRDDVPVPAGVLERERLSPMPALPPIQEQVTFEGMDGWPYAQAIEWRFVRGGFREEGPAQVWSRVRIPIVAGAALDGVERIAAVADSANGLSKELDMRAYLFVPTSIAITLDRLPDGDWTYLGATTHIGAEGIGFTSSTLGDARGLLGTASQTLILEPRRGHPAAPGQKAASA